MESARVQSRGEGDQKLRVRGPRSRGAEAHLLAAERRKRWAPTVNPNVLHKPERTLQMPAIALPPPSRWQGYSPEDPIVLKRKQP